MTPRILSLGGLVLASTVGCKSSHDTSASKAPPAPAAAQAVEPTPTPAPVGTLVPVRIEAIDATIQMPEGTTVKGDAHHVHLENGALMVNLSPVDEYAPTYAKVSDAKAKGVEKVLRAEQNGDGFVVIKFAKSELYPEGSYDVDTRITIGGKPFDCGAGMSTQALAEAVAAACLSVVSDGASAQPPAQSAAASAPAKTAAKPTAAKAAAKPSVQSSGSGSTVSGGLPPEVIRRIIGTARPRVAACYEKALLKNPKLAGTVKVSFVIGSDGRVSAATDGGSSLGDAAVSSCVTGIIRGLQFPAPMDGHPVKVVYPFAFKPS